MARHVVVIHEHREFTYEVDLDGDVHGDPRAAKAHALRAHDTGAAPNDASRARLTRVTPTSTRALWGCAHDGPC